jgi:2-hydroxychromene-2-carboxylate isomerase
MGAVVDFYFGVGSRYSYLAASQLDRITGETGAAFVWKPVSSPDLYPDDRNPFSGPPVSPVYDFPWRRRDAKAWARLYGIPFREPHGRLRVDSRLLARAAIAGGRLGAVEACSRRLMEAVFVDDRAGLDRDDVIACAGQIGLDCDAFAALLDSPETETMRARNVAEAKVRSVFGVPTFAAGDHLIFGNDRLPLLVDLLRSMQPS